MSLTGTLTADAAAKLSVTSIYSNLSSANKESSGCGGDAPSASWRFVHQTGGFFAGVPIYARDVLQRDRNDSFSCEKLQPAAATNTASNLMTGAATAAVAVDATSAAGAAAASANGASASLSSGASSQPNRESRSAYRCRLSATEDSE